MKYIEYTTTDRSEWPKGAWDTEPDKVQWQDEVTGLPCLAVRNPRLGHWCGYVGVLENNPLFSKHYMDGDIDVHGGLTFSGKCSPGREETGICHVPSAGESDNVWWFGFDCAHAGDYSPLLHVLLKSMQSSVFEDTYKTLPYVKSECSRLARQLAV